MDSTFCSSDQLGQVCRRFLNTATWSASEARLPGARHATPLGGKSDCHTGWLSARKVGKCVKEIAAVTPRLVELISPASADHQTQVFTFGCLAAAIDPAAGQGVQQHDQLGGL